MHSRIRKSAALRLRLARYSRQISSPVGIIVLVRKIIILVGDWIVSKLNNCYKASVCNLEDEFICEVEVETTASFITLVFPEGIEKGEWEEGLHITFYDDLRGLVTYKCRLERYTKRGKRMAANCNLGKEQKTVQRRNDMKIRLSVSISVQKEDEPDKGIEVDAIIKDISAGGILFISDYPFEVGQVVAFEFTETDEPLHLECEIIRTQPYKITVYGEEIEKPGYGCRFINLHGSSEAQIRSYVFRQDLLMRRKDRRL